MLGNKFNGQLGIGNYSATNVPIETLLPVGKTALSITSGRTHSCAVLDDSRLYCWGSNSYNAAGNASNPWGNTPTPIEVSIPDVSMASQDIHKPV